MSTTFSKPSTPRQQELLDMIAALYAHDERILAVLLFGSLGRGGGDVYSDLDLAVVVRDDVEIDLPGELARVAVAAEQSERVLFTEVAGDEGYLLLQSLSAIALRYHPLQAMSPYVLEGWHVLCGSLNADTINQAARANDEPTAPLSQQVHRALWLGLSVDVALQRRQFWRALPSLERMRGALVGIFAAGRGGKRAYEVFEREASAALRAKLGRTFPQYFPDAPEESLRSMDAALVALLDLLEQDLEELGSGQVELGAGEREVIVQLRARQAALNNRQA